MEIMHLLNYLLMFDVELCAVTVWFQHWAIVDCDASLIEVRQWKNYLQLKSLI